MSIDYLLVIYFKIISDLAIYNCKRSSDSRGKWNNRKSKELIAIATSNDQALFQGIW